MANCNFGVLTQKWCDLEARGIPLEPMEYRLDSCLTINDGLEGWRSEIRERENGRFIFILPVFIRRDRPGKTVIRDFWLETPWQYYTVDWLEEPNGKGRKPKWYSFPGESELFARNEVLNHRIKGPLSRGDIREGLLLGVGSRPREVENYKTFDKIPVTLTILDQWDCEHPATLEMEIILQSASTKTIIKSKRIPLFTRTEMLRGIKADKRKCDDKGVRATKSMKHTTR